MAGLWCVYTGQRFLVSIFLLISSCYVCFCAEEQLLKCGDKINLQDFQLKRTYSGIINVEMPKDFTPYLKSASSSTNRDCDIVIMFDGGYNLQIELYYLDIMPKSNDISTCSTGLDVLDSTQKSIYGKRLCMEGWEWEKMHREKKQEKKVVESSALTFRLYSETNSYRGTGFKAHYNLFRPYWPCTDHQEFKCERLQRCVHDDITCDGWDDCGDDSDETDDAGCRLLTVSEIFAVIIGIFLFLGTCIATAVFLIKFRRVLKRNHLQRKESKLALDEERRSMREPSLQFPHRVNSMESVNKSQYSRMTGRQMDVTSLIDRMELEKSDKYRDNMSERSYKSNRNRQESERSGPTSRKGRGASKSRERLDPDAMDKNSDRFEKGEEEESERKRRRRSRYSDDDDYDSDRDRRRRRRRRYDRSDDDDDYSDDDRRRRRRNKSRSKDRLNGQEGGEENPDNKEGDKEEKRRERRRYDRSSDEDYDSEEERRRRRRRSRDRRRYYSSDEDYDSEEERRRRRRRDRRRYDRSSDEDYNSDRKSQRRGDSDDSDHERRYRRRSRDRRSRDVSEDRVEKKDEPEILKQDEEKVSNLPESRMEPVELNKPNVEKEVDKPTSYNRHRKVPQNVKERPVTPPVISKAKEEPQYHAPPPPKSDNIGNNNRPNQYSPQPRPSTPPKSDQLHSYSRPRRSNDVTPKSNLENNQPNGESDWKPRSERRRQRRSRGPSSNDVYEDVTPSVRLENHGYHEESV